MVIDILKIFVYSFLILGIIIGFFIFGIGIVLVGGCVIGIWYCVGEGLIGSWIVLVLYVVIVVIIKIGILKLVMDKIN